MGGAAGLPARHFNSLLGAAGVLAYSVLVPLYTPIPPASLSAPPDTILLLASLGLGAGATVPLLAAGGKKRLLGAIGAGLVAALAVLWSLEAGLVVLLGLLPLASIPLHARSTKWGALAVLLLGLVPGVIIPLAYGLGPWGLVYYSWLPVLGAILGYTAATLPPETWAEKAILVAGIAALIAIGVLVEQPYLHSTPLSCKPGGDYYGRILGASMPENETRVLLLLGLGEERCFVLVGRDSLGLGGEIPPSLVPLYLRNRYLEYHASRALEGPVKIIVASRAGLVASPVTGLGLLVEASILALVLLTGQVERKRTLGEGEARQESLLHGS